MKILMMILCALTLISCTYEDDSAPLFIEPIFTENPKHVLKLDIIYVLSSDNPNKSIYHLNESEYIKTLNGCYFHRNNIGFILGESKTIINDELYNLKDNRNEEASVFLRETKASFKKDRLNIYIIKRCNTIAIAGIGKSQRALITDEFLFSSTSPHEIGHALNLPHLEVEGNIMCQIRPYLRKDFTRNQVQGMSDRIAAINND